MSNGELFPPPFGNASGMLCKGICMGIGGFLVELVHGDELNMSDRSEQTAAHRACVGSYGEIGKVRATSVRAATLAASTLLVRVVPSCTAESKGLDQKGIAEGEFVRGLELS